MENSLLKFYKRAYRKTAITVVVSGLSFLVVSLYLQYREKIEILKQQANYVEKSLRNDILSGNNVYVYETCRSLFFDRSIENLKVVKGSKTYCDLSKGRESFFFVSVKVPILFNPSDSSSAENIVGFVSLKLNAEIIIVNLAISIIFLVVIISVFYFASRNLHRAIRQEVVTPLGILSKIMATNSRDAKSVETLREGSRFSEMYTLSSSYVDLINKLKVTEENLFVESKRAALVDVSRRVAHDIRSPLSVLNIISDKMKMSFPEEGGGYLVRFLSGFFR